MKRIIHQLPFMLVLSRIIIGVVIFLITLFGTEGERITICWLIIAGFVSDFLDGYIARLLHVSTQKLRRMDTIVDRVFWLSVLYAAWVLAPGFLIDRKYTILLVLGLEALNYLISFVRFRKEIATHAILSKLWAVTLLVGFCDLVLHGNSLFLFDTSIVFGVISRIDTGLIMLILPRWDHDIPSFYHAILVRRGKEIKRLKIFNG